MKEEDAESCVTFSEEFGCERIASSNCNSECNRPDLKTGLQKGIRSKLKLCCSPEGPRLLFLRTIQQLVKIRDGKPLLTLHFLETSSGISLTEQAQTEVCNKSTVHLYGPNYESHERVVPQTEFKLTTLKRCRGGTDTASRSWRSTPRSSRPE